MAAAKPRIAIVSSTAPPTSGGGVGVAHYNLARALRQLGYPAELFVFFERGAQPAGEGPMQGAVHRFGPNKRVLKALLLLNKWLFGLLAPGKTAWNTVDIFTTWPGMHQVNRALAQFRPDVIIVPDHGAAALWLRMPGQALVHMIAHHNPMRLASMDLDTYSELDARWAVALEQRSLRRSSRVSSPSHHMQDWFRQTYEFSGPQAVIPNIVIAEDLARVPAVDLRPRLGLPKEAPLICVPSAQTVVKGSRLLPAVLAGLAASTAQPIGVLLPGELDPDLQQALPNLPETIRLYAPGRLAWDEYIAFLKVCSFGLFLSQRDNYSMALVEAASCGVPMLAFDAGGNRDIIEDRVNGRLLADNQPSAMAAAAAELLAQPATLAALRHSTAQDATRRFDSQAIAQQYLRFWGLDT